MGMGMVEFHGALVSSYWLAVCSSHSAMCIGLTQDFKFFLCMVLSVVHYHLIASLTVVVSCRYDV